MSAPRGTALRELVGQLSEEDAAQPAIRTTLGDLLLPAGTSQPRSPSPLLLRHHGHQDRMVRLVVPSQSLLRHGQSMADHIDPVGQRDPSERTQRGCRRNARKWFHEPTRLLQGNSSAPAGEGGERQRFRGLETSGTAIQRSQRESTASHATVHHAPDGVPSRRGRL